MRHSATHPVLGALLVLALAACVSREADHLTVAGLRAATGTQQSPGRVPPEGLLVKGVVTDSRSSPTVAVELSDPAQEQHVWATGFADPPARGEEIWTVVTGLPQPDDLLGVVYPTQGRVPRPADDRRIADRAALAILVGAVALVTLATLGVASLATRRRGTRRCPGCGAPAEDDWLTCPMCGQAYVRSPPPAVLVAAPQPMPAAAVPSLDDGAAFPPAPSNPTRIIEPGGG